jgi:hypothetical protein
VPQRSVLDPVLYQINKSDLPQFERTTVANFADDTSIKDIGDDVGEATEKTDQLLAFC